MENQEAELKQREYEIAFLLTRPEEEGILGDTIAKESGEVTHRSELTQIKLAYPIKKQSSAYFGFFRFKALPAAVVTISEVLGRGEAVLRFLIVTYAPRAREPRFDPTRRREEVKTVARTETLTNKALEEKLAEMGGTNDVPEPSTTANESQ